MSSICIHSRSRFGHGHSRSSSEPSVWPNVSTMTNGAVSVEKLSPSRRMPWTLRQSTSASMRARCWNKCVGCAQTCPRAREPQPASGPPRPPSTTVRTHCTGTAARQQSGMRHWFIFAQNMEHEPRIAGPAGSIRSAARRSTLPPNRSACTASTAALDSPASTALALGLRGSHCNRTRSGLSHRALR